MKKFILPAILILLIVFQVNAQQKKVYGTVYAFKNLALKNITVTASKAKTTAQTDSLGKFNIVCDATDKLEFSGEGFKKLTLKTERNEKIVKVKLIFKGGSKNIDLAVKNNYVTREALENYIELHSDQNVEYYNYSDIFSAISKIYASNDNITVRGNSVYVRKDKSSNSSYPAIFIVNGKLALDLSTILMGDIESIEIIPDGSSLYGPGAANGVVQITTFDKNIKF